jgi:hypothetical protein
MQGLIWAAGFTALYMLRQNAKVWEALAHCCNFHSFFADSSAFICGFYYDWTLELKLRMPAL